MPVDPASADARRLARTAGLKDLRLPHLEEVDRRRAQLWSLSLLVAVAVPAVSTAMGLNLLPAWFAETLDVRTTRLTLVALLVVVLGYVAEREVTLRRLTALLVQERVLTASLVNRVDELNLLLRATRAMNSGLDLRQVLEQIADAAHTLLDAGGVTVLLVVPDDPGQLEVAVSIGETPLARGVRQPVGAGLAGGAALRRDALLVAAGETGGVFARRHLGEALVAPMETRDGLVGVLSVSAGTQREPFTEFDLRGIAVFADAAAAAITNAQAYGVQVETVTRLLEEDSAKDEFLAVVTHELRTPLTSVIGLLTTMSARADALSTEEVRSFSELARTQGWRLDRLIEDLLDAARVKRTPLSVHPEPMDPRVVVEQAVAGLRGAFPQALIEVDVEPMHQRLVDVDAVTRIVENLLSNAVKYTPATAPISVRASEEPGGVRLQVRDHGAGIPAPHREAVFERFVRGEDPFNRGGLGLGLYIVRALAEAHGGWVEVVDTPGGGATFTVWLAAPTVQ